MTTPYEILGINKDAKYNEIKNAYKSMAFKLQTIPNNKEKLKILNDAYLTLKNGLYEKKDEPVQNIIKESAKQKDDSNSENENIIQHRIIKPRSEIKKEDIEILAPPPVMPFNINAIMEPITPLQNTMIDLTKQLTSIHFVSLTLMEIQNGFSKKITFNVKRPCIKCINQPKFSKLMRLINKCEECNGTNFIFEQIEKTITSPKSFDITTITNFDDDGDYNFNTGKNDNMIVKYRLAESEKFLVKNNYDLFCTYPITIYEAFHELSLYFNDYHFTYNAIIKDGDVLYCDNLGLPMNKKDRGKLLIKFKYIYPKKILTDNDLSIFLEQPTKNINKNTSHKTRKLQLLVKDSIDDDLFENEYEKSF